MLITPFCRTAQPDGFSCKADSFFPYNACAEWLQPSSLVRLLFPRNTTYMVGPRVLALSTGAGLTSANGCQALVYCVHNLQSIHCLQQPEAVEVEGPAWPFQVRGRPMCWCGTWHARPRLSRSLRVGVAILRQEDVPYASRDTAYCSDNLDCPMSYCQVGHSPVGTSAVFASRGPRAHAHGMRPRCGSRRAVCSGSVAC